MRRTNISISCIADANPEPVVSLEKKNAAEVWKKLNMTADLRPYNATTYWWTFTFYDSSRDIVGAYRCAAFNGIMPPTVSKELYIEIMGMLK